MQVNGNTTIACGIADVAWGQFVQFTTYKAEEAGSAWRTSTREAQRKNALAVVKLFPKPCVIVSMIVLTAVCVSIEILMPL
jgi:hypothetical protein